MEDNIAEIPLSKGACTIVDSEDFEGLNEHKWCITNFQRDGYAKRDEGGRTIYMHRVIMNAPAGVQVDHINGNGLDNRKANLRLCTSEQNQQNSRKRKRGTSRFKGVTWHENKWRARITINGKQINIGRYRDEVLAAKAYDKKAIELYGEFANLNFPSQKAKLISEKKQKPHKQPVPRQRQAGASINMLIYLIMVCNICFMTVKS